MKKAVGITEKRLANKRFKRTEEVILKAFFECGDDAGTVKVAKRAGVARSTIFFHHRTVRNIVTDYEKYILNSYRKMMRKILVKKNTQLKTLFAKMLIFMALNKRIFEMILKRGDKAIVERMINTLKERILTAIKIPASGREKIFKVYRSEVVTLINEWCKKGFDFDEIGTVVGDIIYLTETARTRLFPIKD